MRWTRRTGGAVLAALVAAGAQGSILRFNSAAGLEGLGSYTGQMNWTTPASAGGPDGTLVLTLVNTSAPDNGGYITGFAFNLVDGLTAHFVEDPKALASWRQHDAISAPPYGMFDVGAAIGDSWLGGGNPSAGVPVGASWEFTFTIMGEESFLNSLAAEDLFHPTGDWEFLARFRGFNDEGSDKVPARLPAPGAACALALAGLIGRRRR